MKANRFHVLGMTVLGAMALISPAAVLAGEEPTLVRDVSDWVAGLSDGLPVKIIPRKSDLIIGWGGTGQACYDGWIIAACLGKEPKHRKVLELGLDFSLSKEQGAVNSSPRLVDIVGENRYVINLTCGPSFPDRDLVVPPPGLTGNIILYDEKTGAYRNLTCLNGRSGYYERALRWFPKEKAILGERSEVGGSDEPSPKRGTGKPFVIVLPSGKRETLDNHPDLKEWYDAYAALQLTWEAPKEREAGKVAVWTLSDSNSGTTMIFNISDHEFPRLFCVGRGLACVSHSDFGTALYDVSRGLKLVVSEHVAIDYDCNSSTILLSSAQCDKEGRYRYWLLDLAGLLAHYHEKVAKGATASEAHGE